MRTQIVWDRGGGWEGEVAECERRAGRKPERGRDKEETRLLSNSAIWLVLPHYNILALRVCARVYACVCVRLQICKCLPCHRCRQSREESSFINSLIELHLGQAPCSCSIRDIHHRIAGIRLQLTPTQAEVTPGRTEQHHSHTSRAPWEQSRGLLWWKNTLRRYKLRLTKIVDNKARYVMWRWERWVGLQYRYLSYLNTGREPQMFIYLFTFLPLPDIEI